MPNSNKIPDSLLKSLEASTLLMTTLLDDIKDHSTSLALVQVKLESLTSNVDSLSKIVREGNGQASMVTRLALVEKVTEDIEEGLDELKAEMVKDLDELKTCFKERELDEKTEDEKSKAFKRERLLARMKVVAVAAPGLVALAMMVAKIFMGEITP